MENTYYSEWIAASSESERLRKQNAEYSKQIEELQQQVNKLKRQTRSVYRIIKGANGRRYISRCFRK